MLQGAAVPGSRETAAFPDVLASEGNSWFMLSPRFAEPNARPFVIPVGLSSFIKDTNAVDGSPLHTKCVYALDGDKCKLPLSYSSQKALLST